MTHFLIFLTVVLSSLIKGITGFGFALISLPILLIWFSPTEIIPVLMICNLIASLFIICQKKEHKLLDKSSMLLIIAGGLFTILGVLILKYIDTSWVIKFMGILFILSTFCTYFIPKRQKIKISNYVYIAVGAIIGVITGTISISGPPLALFLKIAKIDNKKFREIFAWFSIITAIIAIVGYWHINLITAQTLELSLQFSPILLTGTFAGKYINKKLSLNNFQLLNNILIFISCFLLLINN
jgi:hypothetical protein